MGKIVWSEKGKKVVRLIGVTGAVYLSLRYFVPPLAPFLAALVVGACLSPAVEWLAARLRVPKTVGATVLVVGVMMSLFLVVLWLGRVLLGQAQELATRLPFYWKYFDHWAKDCCGQVERLLRLSEGEVWQQVTLVVEQAGGRLREMSMSFVVDQTLPMLKALGNVGAWMAVFVIAAVMAARDWPELQAWMGNSAFENEWRRLWGRLADVGRAYVRSEMTIVTVVAVVSAAGLWLLGNPYALLLACGIAVVDLLPIFGAGTVYVPWVIVSLFQGEYGRAAILGTLYLACYFLRNTIEARKMGNRLGFHPLLTLAAAYVGWKLFGLIGFLLGPIGLVVIAEFG